MRKTIVSLLAVAVLGGSAAPASARNLLTANAPTLSGAGGTARIISTGSWGGGLGWGERSKVECIIEQLVNVRGHLAWLPYYSATGNRTTSTSTKGTVTAGATDGEFRTRCRRVVITQAGGVVRSGWVQSPKVRIDAPGGGW